MRWDQYIGPLREKSPQSEEAEAEDSSDDRDFSDLEDEPNAQKDVAHKKRGGKGDKGASKASQWPKNNTSAASWDAEKPAAAADASGGSNGAAVAHSSNGWASENKSTKKTSAVWHGNAGGSTSDWATGDAAAAWGSNNDWTTWTKRHDWSAAHGNHAQDGSDWKKWEGDKWSGTYTAKAGDDDDGGTKHVKKNADAEDSHPRKKTKTDDATPWNQEEDVKNNNTRGGENTHASPPLIAVHPQSVLPTVGEDHPARLPTKTEEWAVLSVQRRLFPDLPHMPKGWLRCCTKSTPHQMYYFNRFTQVTTFEFVDVLESVRQKI
eukprot:GEMP01061994.1.p1 GENE.GEMP01061994.1~~GEMP01061994.1.p1  ORF type:complete len:321 (+),score=89.54 GEMP01061994.1:71-1033(+)